MPGLPAWPPPEQLHQSSWSDGQPQEPPGGPVPAKAEWSCCQPEPSAEVPEQPVPPPKEPGPSDAEAVPLERPDAEHQPAEPSGHQDGAEPPEDAEPPGLEQPQEFLLPLQSKRPEPEA